MIKRKVTITGVIEIPDGFIPENYVLNFWEDDRYTMLNRMERLGIKNIEPVEDDVLMEDLEIATQAKQIEGNI